MNARYISTATVHQLPTWNSCVLKSIAVSSAKCVPFIVSTKNDMGCGFFSSYRQRTTVTHFILVILNVAHFSSWRFKILFMSFSFFFAIYLVVVAIVVPYSIRLTFSSFWIHLIQSRNDNRSFKLLSSALNALTRNIIRLQINNTMSSTTAVMTAIINISSFFCLSFSISFSCFGQIWCRFRSSISLGPFNGE